MIDWTSISGFDWDEGNASKSASKHGVDCGEAESLFVASDLKVLVDKKHSRKEQRFHAFGTSVSGRQLSVTFTVREKLLRVISARPMNQRERKTYGYQKK